MDKNLNKEFKSIATKLTQYFMYLILIFILIMNLIFFISFVLEVNEYNKSSFISQGNLVSENLGIAFSEEINDPMMGSGRGMNRNSNFQMGGSSHNMMYNRIGAIIRGINASSIYLLDRDNRIISESKPELSIDKLLSNYDGKLGYRREKLGVFTYRDQLIAPVFVNGENMYSMVMESQIHTLSGTLSRIAPIPIISSILGATTAYFISKILLKRITEPLILITNVTREYSTGDYSSRTNIIQNDEIGELSMSIDKFAGELEEAKALKEAEELNQREFIASISHELRTPISIMRLSIEGLLNLEIEDSKAREYLDAIGNESNHLQLLVNDLIDLTKLENPNFRIEKSQINLVDVINDAIRSMRIGARKKNVEIETDLPQSIWIDGDYARLRQLFSILIDNAIKFSKDYGIIEVSFKNGIIGVKDYGVGISKADMEKIFERYYRIDTNNTGGSGLGLAIAKEIALRHGFLLEVSSRINEYTEFLLKILK